MGWSAADQRVLREHTQGGQLTHLPTKHKKMLVIILWLATLFATERLYSEAEVNDVLKTVYAEDYVSLRRERGGGKYWLAPDSPEERV